MVNITPEEKHKIQSEKLFNTSERAVKQWVAQFLGKTTDELFDTIPEINESVIFAPCDNSEGKYVEFKLDIVPHDHKVKLDDKLFGEQLIMETVKFFIHSVKVVYGAVMKTTERNDAHDVLMEWNGETLSFEPRYFPDVKKKSDYLGFVLGHMMQIKDTITDPETIAVWKKDFANLMADINETSEQITKENIFENIEVKSKEWMTIPRIGLCVTYLNKEDLPEPKEKLTEISPDKYQDPSDAPPSKTRSAIDDLMKDIHEIMIQASDESPKETDEPEHITNTSNECITAGEPVEDSDSCSDLDDEEVRDGNEVGDDEEVRDGNEVGDDTRSNEADKKEIDSSKVDLSVSVSDINQS
jgi:hypothetical protein